MTLIFLPQLAAYAQTQTPRVGILCVQFADHATNEDARGGVGYDSTAGPMENKYRCRHYREPVFDTTGSFTNPDSATHSIGWSSAFFEYEGSLRQWCIENSGGLHRIQALEARDTTCYSGIVNSITVPPGGNIFSDGIVQWHTLPLAKTDTVYTKTFQFAVGNYLALDCDSIALTVLGDSVYGSLDVLLVVYAGKNIGNGEYPTVPGEGGSPTIILYCEKAKHTAPPYRRFFSNELGALAHEYVHAYSFSAGVNIFDYNWEAVSGANKYNWMGFSVMSRGGCAPEWIPPHLDPWAKLLLGWVSADVIQPDYQGYVNLPVVQKPWQGGRSKVAVVPLSDDFDPDKLRRGRYLIIENRRPYGFDRHIGYDCNNNDSSAWFQGGFLVWEYDSMLVSATQKRGGLTVIEASPGDNVRYEEEKRSSGNDFFSSRRTLSLWTQPGIISATPSSIAGYLSFNPSPESANRPVVIQFPDYDSTLEQNSFFIDIRQPYVNDPYAQCCNNQKKLAYGGDTLALATTVKLNDEAGKGFIVTYLSADGGASWNSAVLNSALTFMKDTVRYEPDTENDASAPSIAWSGSAFHLVWQEKRSDSTYLIQTSTLRGSVHTLDTVSCSLEGPLPVIGARGSNTIKVYYASDSGIIERVSTDAGQTWPDDLKTEVSIGAQLYDALLMEGYQGTTSLSRRPSFSISITDQAHEVLVWHERLASNGNTLFIRRKYSNQKDIYRLSDYGIDTLVNSMSNPHVDIFNNIIHLTSIGEKTETIGQDYYQHVKTVNMLWDVWSGTDKLNVRTFFNRKYDRFERSVDPIVIARPSPSGDDHDKSAFLIWSVNDSVYEGARLRSNALCMRDSVWAWGRDNEVVVFSTNTSRNPQPFRIGNDVLLVAAKGDSTPYHLLSNSIMPSCSDPVLPECVEYEHYISDLTDKRILSHFILRSPILTDSTHRQYMVQVAGPPLTGYDGSPAGLAIQDITRTTGFLLRSSDFVEWQVKYNQSPIFAPRDTVLIRGLMMDSASMQEIGSSISFRVLPFCDDTTFTLGFELPPSHYPEAVVYLCLSINGGAMDLPARSLSTIINIFSDDSYGKQRSAPAKRERYIHFSAIQAYPQPSRDEISVHITGLGEGNHIVEIFDALGKLAHRSGLPVDRNGNAIFTVKTSNYPSGAYYFTVSSGSIIRHGRFFVSR